MWRLKSISANNFMAFGMIEYSFDSKAYMVQSVNHDNESQQSNGGGKSSFVDIIAVALLGYSLTGRDLKSCVSWNNDQGYFTVNIKLENKEHDLTCEINRKVYSNTRATELNILINGEVPADIPTKRGVKDGVDTRAGDNYILQSILDIKADDLLNYFLISGKYYQPFLKINTEKKLEVISRFTNTVVVDKVLRDLIARQKKLISEISDNQNSIAKANGYIEALQDSLNEDAESGFNLKKNQDIQAITLKMEKVVDDIDRLDSELTTESEKKFELHEIDQAAIDEMKELFDAIDSDINSFEQQRTSVKEHIEHVKKHLAGLIECPKCQHTFNLDSDETFADDEIEVSEQAIIEIEDRLKELRVSMADIKNLQSDIDKKKNENKVIEADIRAQQRKIKSIHEQQDRLVKELERLEGERREVERRKFTDERESIIGQIGIRQKEIESYEILNKELAEEQDKIGEWNANFEDFKFFLGNKPLEIICNLCNQYLEFNGSDLNLQIEGFKKLKSGEIRQALNPVIYRSWTNPQPYASFSAGEQCRLNVSVDLAFQQLINNFSKFGGLDLYVNDELLSNLDSLGIQSAAEAFNQLNKTMLLVTHSAADLNFSNLIMIEKKNGISKLV